MMLGAQAVSPENKPNSQERPNNSFNPTAGVGLVINQQLGPAAG